MPIVNCAERLNRLHSEAETSRKSRDEQAKIHLEKSIEAGNLLIRQKELLRDTDGHGTFGKWIEANLTFTHRTANYYMEAAEAAKIESVSILPAKATRKTAGKSPRRKVAKIKVLEVRPESEPVFRAKVSRVVELYPEFSTEEAAVIAGLDALIRAKEGLE